MVNRYVNLTVNGSKAEISVALLYGELPAAAARRAADSNQNGSLDPGELRSLNATLQHQASRWLRLLHQGKARGFTPTINLDLGGTNEVAPKPLVVEARTTLELGGDVAQVFSLEPAGDVPLIGETEVSCSVGPGWHLEASWTPSAKGMQRRYKLSGRLPAGWQTSFALRNGSAPNAPPNRILPVPLVATGLVVVGLFIWMFFRLRRNNARLLP